MKAINNSSKTNDKTPVFNPFLVVKFTAAFSEKIAKIKQGITKTVPNMIRIRINSL